jgi:hypothetical protein
MLQQLALHLHLPVALLLLLHLLCRLLLCLLLLVPPGRMLLLPPVPPLLLLGSPLWCALQLRQLLPRLLQQPLPLP